MHPRFWIELASSVGYGVLSSVIPVFHAEAFIIAAIGSGVLGILPLTIGLTIGQVIGKQALFLAVRHGKKIPWLQRRREKPDPPEGSWRAKWKSWSERTARLVERPRWGYPLVLLSGTVGLPPIYLVTLFAGATKMNFWGFTLFSTIGFFIRTYVLALMTAGVITGLF